MKLLNELLNLSESNQGSSLVGMTINKKLVTDETKNEIWQGNFQCTYNNNLESLEGAPKEVTVHFDCTDNPKLTSLEGAPKKVIGHFSCINNRKLTSLKGGPEKVGRVGGGGYFNCVNNPNLESLEGIPKEVNGDIHVRLCPKITSLKDIHKQITHLDGSFIAPETPIKSHVLGLLLIKGCTDVILDNKEVQKILNKYLPNTRGNKGLIDCQSELLDADLEDYAEL